MHKGPHRPAHTSAAGAAKAGAHSTPTMTISLPYLPSGLFPSHSLFFLTYLDIKLTSFPSQTVTLKNIGSIYCTLAPEKNNPLAFIYFIDTELRRQLSPRTVYLCGVTAWQPRTLSL